MSALLTFGAHTRAAGQEPREAQAAKPDASENPKPQPIPFSHKLHSPFFRDCGTCHKLSANDQDMSYPPEAKCMECHTTIRANSAAISKLAVYYKDQKAVPWVRIYRLPDEVFFSHQRHTAKAKIECSICHGQVAERDVVTPERTIWMEFCVDCHKDKKAPANCRTCHNR